MFDVENILTPTYLIRNFNKVADRISQKGEKFLLMRKNGDKFVLLSSSTYHQLMRSMENKTDTSRSD